VTTRDTRLFPGEPPHIRPLRSHSRWNWRQYFSLHFLINFLLSAFIGGWSAASFVLPANAATTNRPGFTLRQFLQQGHPYHAFDGLHVLPQRDYTARFWKNLSQGKGNPAFPPSAEPAKIKAVSQPLTAAATSTSLHLVAGDSQGMRLEVLVPAGAFDLSKATTAKGVAPQGTLTLTLTQLRGHFSAATSDLGEFQLQITDGQGQVLQGVHLRSPITLVYHYRAKELSNLSLNPGHLYVIWPDLESAAAAAKQSFASYVVPMQNDARASTLTAQTTTFTGTPFVLGSGSNPIQNPPKPNVAEVQGNGGQLSYSYPLVVPPGPPGTAPNLAVVYSSAATNGRKTPTTPANNVGEGWALTLGAISAEQYPDGSVWYSISGIDNVNDRLIPDTTGNNFATEHLSYLQITKITSSFGQPCFRVVDTSSNYYEFGCTSDSLQYYIDSSGNRVNYEFDLDKMVPANEGPGTNGRNLTASYVQDFESNSQYTWVRDSALKQITYGNGTARIGTIDFFYNGPSNYTDPNSHIQYVTQYTNTYESSCNLPAHPPQNQRCDDPIDRSGGMVDPDVMSTLSLQTVKIYTGDNSSNTHLDYSYSFTYQDTAFGNCPSADTTLSSAYCAGNHLLTSITPTVYQNGTGHALPGVTFGYSGGRTNKYDDSSQNNYHMENSWQYLTSYHDHSTGVGASSITYHTAYNNSHGTPYSNGDNRYDPLYCDWNTCQSGTSFYPMDDKMWTEQVVTQITYVGQDSSNSNAAPDTVSYDYWLTKTQGTCPADSMNDSDCVGFGWIPNSGLDWQSYYHGEFRGFGTVLITSPSGDLTVQNYAATWGWDSPASDPRNYLAGQLLEEDVYQGKNVDATKLIARRPTSMVVSNPRDSKLALRHLVPAPVPILPPCTGPAKSSS